MDGVLNETTCTVHKHETGGPRLQTKCGITHNVARDCLRSVRVERALSGTNAEKCGRCFRGAGGY